MQVNPNAAQLHAISGASANAPATRPDAAAKFHAQLQAATAHSRADQSDAPAPAQKASAPAAAEKPAPASQPMPRGSYLDIVA